MRGVDVGDRWLELAEKTRLRVHDHIFPFIDAHFMMPLARTGDREASDNFMVSMRAWADAHRDASMSRLMTEIGRASCRERGCQYVQISGGAVSLTHKQ